MARRYYFEWRDTNETLYRVDIQSDLYIGAEAEINGFAFLSRSSSDVFQAIQATALDLRVIATVSEPLTDLIESDDRYWSVYLYKEGVEQFRGYISNNEIEQPFTADVWELQIECRDALGFLEDLSFVDTLGANWTGNDTFINTVAKALKRGYRYVNDAMNIKINSGLTLADDSVFEENAYLEMDAFVDDNNEPNGCSEVVEDLLNSLNLVIFQYLGDYVIINTNNWLDMLTSSVSYREYDEDGVFDSVGSWPVAPIEQRIGSNINGADIYHINKNQSYISKNYIQSVRGKHTYEYREQIIPNGEMIAAGAGPYTMPQWTLTADAEAFVNGVLIDGKELVGEKALGMTSTPIALKEGNNIEFTLTHEYVDDPTQMAMEITLVGASTYYLRKYPGNPDVFWQSFAGEFIYNPLDGIEQGVFEHSIEVPPLPIDGDLTVKYYTPIFGAAHTVNSKVVVTDVSCKSLEDVEEGIEYTIERTDKESGSVPDVVNIRFSTADTSVVKNSFFDSIGLVIEEIKFNGGGVVGSLDNSINGRLQVGLDRRRTFSGDIKGDITHITPKRVDTLGTGYLMLEFSKDLRNDISQVTMIENISEYVGATYTSEERIVYKESVKPKIK